MSITIPTSSLPPQQSSPLSEPAEQPSPENLLMAAAEMHKMGRLKPKPKVEPK